MPEKRAPTTDPQDHLTLERVYRAHAPSVARMAARLWGPAADVDDLVHDVFLVVQRRLRDFDPARAQLTSWLYGITANVVRRRRRAARVRRLLGGRALEQAAERTVAPGASPLEAIESREASALVYALLEGMSEKLRTALILYELEGLSGEQIAAITGDRLSTVWVRLHRARAKFLQAARARQAKEAR